MARILKEGELIPLIYDKMFKKVFGNPDNPEPIRYLIQCVLKEKLLDVQLLPQDIIGDNHNDKKNSVDVIVTLEDGRKVIVEANTNFDVSIRKRNMRFISRVMSQELDEGDEYTGYHDHYLINLNLVGSEKYPIVRYTHKADNPDIEAKYFEYSQDLTIYCVNISHFTNMCYNDSDKKLDEQEMFLAMINCREYNKSEQFMGVSKLMKKIMNQVREFSDDEILALAYNEEEHDRYMKQLRDYDFEQKLLKKAAEYDERIKAMETESKERIKTMETESKERIKTMETESKERIKTMETESKERIKVMEDEAKERIKDKELKLKEKAKQLGLSDEEIDKL